MDWLRTVGYMAQPMLSTFLNPLEDLWMWELDIKEFFPNLDRVGTFEAVIIINLFLCHPQRLLGYRLSMYTPFLF